MLPVFWQILDAVMSWLAALEVDLGLSERTYDHVDEVLPVLLVGCVVAADTLTEAAT